MSCYSCTAVFNNCFNGLTPCTALPNSQWVIVFTMRINAKAMPINDNYSCHNYNSCRTCLTNRMESVSRHWLLIASWADTHTHTQTHTHANTHTHVQTIHTGSILRNQVCAWFNNSYQLISLFCTKQLICSQRKTSEQVGYYI